MTTQSSELRRSALFFAVSFLQALDNQLLPVLLPVLDTEMPGTKTEYLLVAYAVACGIVPFLTTGRGRGDGLKVLSLSAIVVLGAAAFVFASTTAFPIRLSARAAAGAASGVLSMTLLLAAARTQDGRARAREFTVITAGQLTALVAGVPLAAKFVKLYGVGTTFESIAAIALVLALPLGFLPETPSPAGMVRPQSFIRLFRQRQPALILIATGIVGAGIAGPIGFLSKFLGTVQHLEIDVIGAVYMWSGVGPLLAMPFAGPLIARFKPHRVAVAGSILIAAPILLFPHLAVSLVPAAILLFVCFFIETMRRAALQGTLSDAVARSDLPRFLAFRGVVLQLGLAAGYALAGPQFRYGGFVLVCWVAAILGVTAAMILLVAHRAEPSPQRS